MKAFKVFSVLLLFSMCILFFGCGTGQQTQPLDRSNMDKSVDPGDDFFLFANGTWLESNPIPDEYSRYGSFEELRQRSDEQLNQLIADISEDRGAEPGSNRQMIRDLFNSAMDTMALEMEGISPLKPYFEKIDAISSKDELAGAIAYFHMRGSRPLFSLRAAQDRKNTEMNIANLGQAGLGMSDRDYYLRTDSRSLEIKAAYENFMETLFSLAGYPEEKAAAARKSIMELETRLAEASMTRLERRNPHATYNKMNVKELKDLAPGINWDVYFDKLGIEPEDMNVSQPKFFREASATLQDIDLETWKIYLRWNLLRSNASFLSADFEEASFDFYGRVMSGSKSQQERWKRALGSVNRALGEALGQEYVNRHFPPEAKERMEDLVEHLREAFSERIDQLAWMSEETRKQAHKKLESMNVKIGYPDKWTDYSGLEIYDRAYVLNMMEASRFNTQRNLEKIGEPVDRDEWFMNPQTVNAYYSPTMNEIVFPAGILQPPFFFMDGDDAVNFGAIGMVIGHEMTHGFDDQGRRYAPDGNLRDWWTENDSKRFEELAEVLVDQYNNYVMLDTLTINGELSLGENIADLGGLTIAFQALQNKLEEDGRPGLIDGFTPEQRFFLAYAQVWRNNIREQELMRQLNEGPHSPGEARVNGIVYNLEAFYQAFDIDESALRFIAPENRAEIW